MGFAITKQENEVKGPTTLYGNQGNNYMNFPVAYVDINSYFKIGIGTCLDLELVYNVAIGRYNSIGVEVSFMVDLNHDMKRVAMGHIDGLTYRRPEFTKRKGQVIVMNDCWIGNTARIMNGVTLHNGCVVATGAVVTKDVPPYAIVAGNPAKIIGYRFTEEQIRKLLEIKWWNWPLSKIQENGDYVYGDIDTFLDRFYEEAYLENQKITPAEIVHAPGFERESGKVYLYYPDTDQAYPTYPKVLRSFAEREYGNDVELLIALKTGDSFDMDLKSIEATLSTLENYNCCVNLYAYDPQEDGRPLMAAADAYITSRSTETVQRMDMAEYYGVKMISGVDLPMFD